MEGSSSGRKKRQRKTTTNISGNNDNVDPSYPTASLVSNSSAPNVIESQLEGSSNAAKKPHRKKLTSISGSVEQPIINSSSQSVLTTAQIAYARRQLRKGINDHKRKTPSTSTTYVIMDQPLHPSVIARRDEARRRRKLRMDARKERRLQNAAELKNGDYLDIGDATYECQFCRALMWGDERANKGKKLTENTVPCFSLCCEKGKIQLPLLQKPPQLLQDLMSGKHPKSKNFQDNIIAYNMMFSFTSLGAKFKINTGGRGPYCYTMHGQNYHRIGSLLPTEGSTPKFSQLYIYDTEHEDSNRIQAISSREKRVDDSLVTELRQMIDAHNPHAQAFRMARDRLEASNSTGMSLKLISTRNTDARTHNLPTASEVAAILIGDPDEGQTFRDIILHPKDGSLLRINEMHASYLPLQYPLIFLYGEDGYRIDIALSERRNGSALKRERVTIKEFAQFRIQERREESSALTGGRRLLLQFLPDMYSIVEGERTSFFRTNQKKIRAELYNNLSKAAASGRNAPASTGKRIVLPSTFTGGPRYMKQNYHDAMALCKHYGYPDLFITFTCNPKWPEITRFVKERNLQPEDRPDIVCRIFKMKLDAMIKDFKKNKLFGEVVSVVYTIEFQKRGLPHAHIVLFLHKDSKLPTPEHIDKFISAELPDKKEDPILYRAVTEYMMHGPCGPANLTSPCMLEGKCKKHFPKPFVDETYVDGEGYAQYRRRNNGRTVDKNGFPLDNGFVVPYNAKLLLRYEAHINVEWCNRSASIKYLFKYINKGSDRITLKVSSTGASSDVGHDVDEIKNFHNCRYLSACEAVWRILGFPIHHRSPSVQRLKLHLPGEHTLMFDDEDPIDDVVNKEGSESSMFLHWFEMNKTEPEAAGLTYEEFPSKFVWVAAGNYWKLRDKGTSIGRIFPIDPGAGELYYLRVLLNHIKCPKSYEDLRTVAGEVCDTFKEACYRLGLLDDDREYIDGIKEASLWDSAQYLRHLFVFLLCTDSMAQPLYVWEQTWTHLSDDILRRQRWIRREPGLILTDEQLKNLALAEIEKLLHREGRSLSQFQNMPTVDKIIVSDSANRFIQEEQRYKKEDLAIEHGKLVSSLTEEQKGVYDTIMSAVLADTGGVFFLYGYGGTGKTFIWRSLSAAVRSKGDIVLNVASSGNAALLLPGGRTAHSRFKIPLQIDEASTCNISKGSDLAQLICIAKLIIWDEAPMTSKYCFEALDKTLRDIMSDKNPNASVEPFGGKVVVFGGDFRQILPVIPKGRRQDIVFASINSSYLWKHCKVLTLTRNMRVQQGNTDAEQREAKEFSDWILRIGNGDVGEDNDGESTIEIPQDLLVEKHDLDPIAAIVHTIYPSLLADHDSDTYFEDRAILAPTHEEVEKINDYVLSLIPGEDKEYLSSDTLCKSEIYTKEDEEVYTKDYLNSQRVSGIPNHRLQVKIGAPVMLMRNIDQSAGLVNGTRLIVTQFGNHVIRGRIISGSNIGHSVLIPRMSMSPSDSGLPFKFTRRQFPLSVCFAMTINKSQGQSLGTVGLYLPRPVFTHGQFYVACSRVTSKKGLKILICDRSNKRSDTTVNVVYKEVFNNV